MADNELYLLVKALQFFLKTPEALKQNVAIVNDNVSGQLEDNKEFVQKYILSHKKLKQGFESLIIVNQTMKQWQSIHHCFQRIVNCFSTSIFIEAGRDQGEDIDLEKLRRIYNREDKVAGDYFFHVLETYSDIEQTIMGMKKSTEFDNIGLANRDYEDAMLQRNRFVDHAAAFSTSLYHYIDEMKKPESAKQQVWQLCQALQKDTTRCLDLARSVMVRVMGIMSVALDQLKQELG